MTPPTEAVILCGGRGERLRPLTDTLPKPLAPVLGRPFLLYLIDQLRDAGIKRILLLTGYRGNQIADALGDGAALGVAIQYMQGPEEWDTGRRIFEACHLLDERFVLLYADNLAPFRLQPLWERHQQLAVPLTATLVRKGKGNIRLSADGAIEAYDSTRTQSGLSHVEIGYMIVERDPILSLQPQAGSFSLVLAQLAAQGCFGGYDPGFIYNSIADLPRLRRTEDFLRPRRLLLLDRDGVLNRKAPRGEYVCKISDFSWIEENILGLERLATQGFEFIIISNQAGIGRGMIQRNDVEELHAWMIGELARRGIRIVDVLVCPHHWEDNCPCRKPRPGLFFQASAKHGFWLERTMYIGDDPRDVIAAANATCPCLLVGAEAEAGEHKDLPPHHAAANINEAVDWIGALFPTESVP